MGDTTFVCAGKEEGLGVENLSGSGMIAGETSLAYNEVITINLVSSSPIACVPPGLFFVWSCDSDGL